MTYSTYKDPNQLELFAWHQGRPWKSKLQPTVWGSKEYYVDGVLAKDHEAFKGLDSIEINSCAYALSDPIWTDKKEYMEYRAKRRQEAIDFLIKHNRGKNK